MGACAVFQIVAVQFWSFGKAGLSGSRKAPVSHVSHRVPEKGCAKRTVCVKSVSRTAWNKGPERPHTPQGAKIQQTLFRHGRGDKLSMHWVGIPEHEDKRKWFPFLYLDGVIC